MVCGLGIAYGLCAVPTGFYILKRGLEDAAADMRLNPAMPIVLGIPVAVIAATIGGAVFPLTWYVIYAAE